MPPRSWLHLGSASGDHQEGQAEGRRGRQPSARVCTREVFKTAGCLFAIGAIVAVFILRNPAGKRKTMLIPLHIDSHTSMPYPWNSWAACSCWTCSDSDEVMSKTTCSQSANMSPRVRTPVHATSCSWAYRCPHAERVCQSRWGLGEGAGSSCLHAAVWIECKSTITYM